MLELPEAITTARLMQDTVVGRRVNRVVAMASPHKFAFFSAEPEAYPGLLEGRTITAAEAFGGYVRLTLEDTTLLMGDGVNPRWYAPGEKLPPKHQLLLELEDGGALVASVQMYGGLWAHPTAEGFDNIYYRAAMEKPSPLGKGFSRAYFEALLREVKPSLSTKAFLATEQRIPGLGNGVLQDILFRARIHPKRKLASLESEQFEEIYTEIINTLRKMTDEGGRDTEKDLLGRPGGYATLLSAKTAGKPCPVCGAPILKQAYMGGSVYFCPVCQPL